MPTESAAGQRAAGAPDPDRAVPLDGRPRLAPHARLTYDQARDRHVLLAPETVCVLNATGAAVLALCDGERTVAGILAELRRAYEGVARDEVLGFLARLQARRCLEVRHG